MATMARIVLDGNVILIPHINFFNFFFLKEVLFYENNTIDFGTVITQINIDYISTYL